MTGPAGEVPPFLRIAVERAARSHGGVEYDAHDRNGPLVERAAAELGIPAYPSETVPPRTIRGRTPDQDSTVEHRWAVAAMRGAMRAAMRRNGRVTPRGVVDELVRAGLALVPAGAL